VSPRRGSRRVAPSELRRIFNEGGYLERVGSNELIEALESERPARPEAQQPLGTMSRMVWYYAVDSDGTLAKVALVHEYRRPDGSIGGSGRPDPKRLIVDDEIWYC
jgi:hypothetical protein